MLDPQSTVLNLKLLCRQSGWTKYSHLRKDALYDFVRKQTLRQKRASRIIKQYILIWFRKLQKTTHIVNTTDFLTFEDLQQRPIENLFKLRSGKQVFLFCPWSLVKNILHSGKFENPYNRQLLTNNQLSRLQRKFFSRSRPEILINPNTYFTENLSLCLLQNTLPFQRNEERQTQSTIEHLCENIDNIIHEVLNHVHTLLYFDVDNVTNSIQYITNDLYPNFQYSFHQLYDFRPLQAKTVIANAMEGLENQICGYVQNSNIKAQMLISFFKLLTSLFKKVYRCSYESPQLDYLQTCAWQYRTLIGNPIPDEFGILPMNVVTNFLST